jgi:hypothetical protein
METAEGHQNIKTQHQESGTTMLNTSNVVVTSTEVDFELKASRQPSPAGKSDNKKDASETETLARHDDDGRLPSLSQPAIDPAFEPFVPTPWWAPGHRVRGLDPNKLFVNENSVRARAGLLMSFAFIVIILLTNLENPSAVVPYLAIPILLDVS